MSLSTILILGYIVAFFSSFIVAIGGIATWQVVSDLRDQAASQRSARYTEYQGALKAA